MNRREMIKMAYQAPPKNEVIDEIDKLFKQASPADEDWMKIITADPMLSKSLGKLPEGARQQAAQAMVSSITGSKPDELGGLAKSMSGPVLSRLQATGHLPTTSLGGLKDRILGAGGKALMGAAPIMVAGAGLYGLSSLINMVKEKYKENKFEADKATAFGKLLKDPTLSSQDPKKLKEIFDLYADVSPMVINHPVLASSILQDLGGVGAAANTMTLKSLGEIYKNREQASVYGTQNRNQGWTLAATDPQKLRNLIGGEMK